MSQEYPLDAWYAVSGAAGLEAGDVMPVRLFGEERVAWRGDDGHSHVWQNSCVHRGMRLQYGYVDGNRLACRYHGWRFGGDAHCEFIPAHPEMTPPDDYCIPAFQSAEKGGLIWTTAGKPADSPPEFRGNGEPVFCRTVTVNASPATVGKYIAALSKQEIAPGYLLIQETYREFEIAVVVAVQPTDTHSCQLHVSSAPASSEQHTQALRLHVSAWARRTRDAIETESLKETAA
ncbi:MAG: Rieske 2Fe-2S domain-containing protein [Alphaproteobacteria bacterium]